MKPKAICVVGHENWGKSETLYYLAGKSYRQGWIEIAGISVFVKHGSNDDKPKDFINFIKALRTDQKPCVIVALCPNFKRPEARTKDILNTLRKKKGYKLYFWVLLHKYNSMGVVETKDISKLKKYGEVKVYKGKDKAPVRAKLLKTYISKILKA
jgi:hypothetical protein